ncbi:MAG: hypothetical protein ACM3N0_01930 [Chloroflexota bacterium]
MAQTADLPSASQLAGDLAEVAKNGLGRPLYGKMTAADIPYLTAVADELATDVTLSIERQIVDVVLPAVRQLYGPNQDAACRLLWIENLNSPAELVAQKGKRVPFRGEGGRHELAAFALGVSVSDFEKRKRHLLLETVASQILLLLQKHRTERNHLPGIDEHRRTFEDDPPLPLIQAIAWKVVELHYSILVALFVDDLSRTLPREDSFGRENHYPNAYVVWETCSERIFRFYVEWLATYRMARDTDELSALSEAGLKKLMVLYEASTACVPTPIGEIDTKTLAELFEDATDHLRLDDSPLYTDVWIPWYRHEIMFPDPENNRAIEDEAGRPVPKESRPHNLHIIAATSADTFRLASAETELIVPFDTMARNLAYKQIASCYLFDEWTPLYGGASLRDRAASFIDRKKTELDIEKLVWFDNE